MTKLDLQQELLEKVKPGTKPSDIKRQVKYSQIPKPVNQDEGYESDSSDKSVPVASPFKPDLPKSGPANNLSLPNQELKSLQNQISSLQKRLATYQDFKEADLKIKEQYKQEIAEHKKTIAELKSQAKPTGEPQPEEIKTFLCSSCQQTKPTQQLSRVFGNCSFCLDCSKKARKQAQQEKQPSPQPEEFICHSCQQIKQELPNKMKLDSTLQTYLICSPCRPTLKEFNEADLITDDL